MKEKTVYLGEKEVEGLRWLAAESGESQTELIRESVRRLLRDGKARTFHSMGRGVGSGEARPQWDADAVREKTLGRQ